jgi:phage terminase large subunit-like protein
MMNEARALWVKNFIEGFCTYSKGEWAGRPFRLLPWQWEEVVKPLFGQVNKDGTRQYRTCYIEIPKKNGKSEFCAAVALYMLTNDGEKGAEVYCAAADREQASIVYQAAAAMVHNSSELSKHLRCIDSRKRIIYHRKNSYFQVLSSESYTKHGLNPSCVIVDEIHAHPNDELWNVLTAGTDYARRQQVVMVITTAGVYDRNSIWWRLRSKAIQVASGVVKDDRFLPVLYLADHENENPESEELWSRVNPSLGQIFSIEKIRQDYQEAKQNPIDYQNFLRFRLNIPIKSITRWMPVGVWDKCAWPVEAESLSGKLCYGGLDLSNKWDLTAFVLVFPPQEGLDRYAVLPFFFCPEETIIKRSRSDAVHYEIWQQQGHITATPGDVIDEQYIKKAIIAANGRYRIREVGFDPWNATSLTIDLFNNHGFIDGDGKSIFVEMRQGFKTLSEPTKSVLVHAQQRQIAHGGHPVLAWCIDNMTVRTDANENVAPDKEKATDRIDGAVALIMAWGRMLYSYEEQSVYNERGVYVVGEA